MIMIKVATVFLLALAVGAEKKIELQDIEEDNLKNEKEKEIEKSDGGPQSSGPGTGPGLVPLDFLKSGLLRYFENPTVAPQQQRYVHQYAVTEPPERPAPVPKVQYAPPTAQHAMVGYLSNVPMQVYLVPQYYSDQSDQPTNPHINPQYQSAGVARVAAYQTAPEAVQTQTNYIEVPSYVAPPGKTYVQQYTQPVTYVGYQAQPTAPPQATVAPVITYQVPVVQYTQAIVQPTTATKTYYQTPQYTESNSVDDVHEHEDDQSQYSTQTEVPYHKPALDFPRHYNSRTPLREDYRNVHPNAISELPHPNPILLKSPHPHLAHIPKTLPVYHRPLTKPVYQGATGLVPSVYTPRPHELYGPPPIKRRPTSLLDSYIPSSVQVEYLKRGIVKEPLQVYDAITSGRVPHPLPRHYERGFLPNQMYHTAGGGVTFGHYKRTPKLDKITHH